MDENGVLHKNVQTKDSYIPMNCDSMNGGGTMLIRGAVTKTKEKKSKRAGDFTWV